MTTPLPTLQDLHQAVNVYIPQHERCVDLLDLRLDGSRLAIFDREVGTVGARDSEFRSVAKTSGELRAGQLIARKLVDRTSLAADTRAPVNLEIREP